MAHSTPPPKEVFDLSSRRALKTKSCSKFDSWIVPASTLKNRDCDLWILPAWSLQNERGVPDGTHGLSLHGALKTRRWSGLDSVIVPQFCSGSAPCRALKTGSCFLIQCFYLKRVNISRMRNFFF